MIIGSIDKLNHEMTSYKTRRSSYGDPTGCMEGTRVKVLEDLDTWALNADGSTVYWMVGMAGIGKSTIAHTFCEKLDAKNMLGGCFFASRASEKTSNARLVIPVIAHALARASPCIKFEVIKAIEDEPALAEPTYINIDNQFTQLIYKPIRTTASKANKLYKVVVIDAIDECGDLAIVAALVKLVLRSASEIPLKVFISSREEHRISKAFSSGDAKNLYLHEIEKDVVQKDIREYLKTSLDKIRDEDHPGTAEKWPSQLELNALVARSGTLFIYAATAVRYIRDGNGLYKSRLSEMAIQGLESVVGVQTNLDDLYVHILGKAFKEKPKHEIDALQDLVSIITFLRNPLPMEAITSLSEEADAHSHLSPLSSVIHIPKQQPGAVVAPFHASFPDFITDPKRCSPERCPLFRSLVASEAHELLALKCLKLMNQSLKYNICEIPQALTVSRRESTNDPGNVDKISEALKYSCLHWAAHLAAAKVFDTDTILVDALRIFLHKHLLHWIECLSMLGKLQAGLKSIGSIATALSVSPVSRSLGKNLCLTTF
jgi:nucleoside-triphosphatase THEP1